MQTLTQLEALLPEEARDELMYAAQVLGEIDAAAGQACPSCGGGIAQIPPVLFSAGQIAEPAVVVVPSPVISGERDEAAGRRQEGRAAGRRQEGRRVRSRTRT